jgi:hypothetical protein
LLTLLLEIKSIRQFYAGDLDKQQEFFAFSARLLKPKSDSQKKSAKDVRT